MGKRLESIQIIRCMIFIIITAFHCNVPYMIISHQEHQS